MVLKSAFRACNTPLERINSYRRSFDREYGFLYQFYTGAVDVSDWPTEVNFVARVWNSSTMTAVVATLASLLTWADEDPTREEFHKQALAGRP